MHTLGYYCHTTLFPRAQDDAILIAGYLILIAIILVGTVNMTMLTKITTFIVPAIKSDLRLCYTCKFCAVNFDKNHVSM